MSANEFTNTALPQPVLWSKGREEAAGCPPEIHIGPIGVGLQLEKLLAGEGIIIATIICGDSYFNENADLCKEYVRNVLNVHQPDMVVTGPAFNAGRYGMACGTVAQVAAEMGIPVISGIYPENPGYELYRPWMYAVETGNSAASMRTALPAMAALIKRFIATGEILVFRRKPVIYHEACVSTILSQTLALFVPSGC